MAAQGFALGPAPITPVFYETLVGNCAVPTNDVLYNSRFAVQFLPGHLYESALGPVALFRATQVIHSNQTEQCKQRCGKNLPVHQSSRMFAV